MSKLNTLKAFTKATAQVTKETTVSGVKRPVNAVKARKARLAAEAAEAPTPPPF